MIPQKISHFQIKQKLGSGGMGEVFLAHDTILDRDVALKILPSDFVSNHDRMRRFVREAKTASAISHPNVAHIYEIGENDGIHFIAMEFIQGETLSARMKSQSLTSQEIIDVATQAADALQAAHSKGIIHRDIKPANMIIDNRGQIKLVDFGLAKVQIEEASISSRVSTASQTDLGIIIGTLPYMSPEQVLGKIVDHRSDFFSLGTVLYELATRSLPFQGSTSVELADAILHKQPLSVSELNHQAPPGLAKIILKMLEKDPDARYQSANEILTDLNKIQSSKSGPVSAFDVIKKPSVAITLFVLILIVSAISFWFYHRNSKIQWAREVALLQATRMVDEGKYADALSIALQAEKYIPNDPLLKTLWPSMSTEISIQTNPSGADIFLQDYNSSGENWKNVGTSPIRKLRVPKGYFRWKISKDGFRTIYVVMPRAFWQREQHVSYSLKDYSEIPTGMVHIPGLKSDPQTLTAGLGVPTVPIQEDYVMDEFEVSNRDFKKFVDSGGYQNRKYWKIPFVKDGRELSFEEAMKYFHDATGRPGPLQWEVGSYAHDEDNNPVTGISWYEAAAYAEFVGKSLPTIHHWYHAAGVGMHDLIIAHSNFNSRGVYVVGNRKSMSPYGTYNMAGNSKEWCWTETTGGKRFILGGSYLEPVYMFMETDQRSPFDREKTFGFRCVKYLSPLPKSLVESFIRPSRDYSKEKPVDDAVFSVLKTFYSYDKKDLNSKIESSEVQSYLRKEKVSFDGAYGNERMIAYLFLPLNAKPPYQTIVFFPGKDAQFFSSSENLAQTGYVDYVDFLIRSGRVVVYPVYKGTFERGGGPNRKSRTADEDREWRIQIIKDVSRMVDYLESRGDINKHKLAYYGYSWGAYEGSIVGAVENRFQTMILLHAGLSRVGCPPEIDAINFVPRIRMPVLMINGQYDHVFPVETLQNPMFQLLGTPAKDKAHLIFEGGHWNPRKEVIKVVLDWLDRYLGPVS